MKKKTQRIINRFILKHRMLLLLLNTLLIIVSFPLVQTQYAGYLFLIEVLFNVLLIVGIYLVSRNKQVVAVAALVAIMSITIIGFDKLINSRPLLLFGLLAETIFFLIALVTIIRHVMLYKKVTEDKIFGAITAYLFIGIIGATVCTMIELANPNSFFFSSGFIMNQQQLTAHRFYLSQFIYFSFVTLSTLGYGDIIPVTSEARLFASLEAVTGQLYVAVLIARLVGLHITQSHKKLK